MERKCPNVFIKKVYIYKITILIRYHLSLTHVSSSPACRILLVGSSDPEVLPLVSCRQLSPTARDTACGRDVVDLSFFLLSHHEYQIWDLENRAPQQGLVGVLTGPTGNKGINQVLLLVTLPFTAP